MTSPTPAMTAQEALATLRQGRSPETPYGRPHAAGDADVWAATVALETRLADAERRATEAGALVVRAEHRISGLNEDIARMADRLSAVEARCGLMREALEALRAWVGVVADKMDIDPDGTRVTINAVGPNGRREVAARSLREMYAQVDSILAYPGGKSDQGEKEQA